jgi:dihydropteroate synthase
MDAAGEKTRWFHCGRYRLPLGEKTYLMGIINVTPDSFSDGGCYLTSDSALRQAEALLQAGADLLDIGGESSRPGSTPVDEQEELRRVIPIIKSITGRFACPVSVDTVKPAVARSAIEAGACIINDINGLQAEPKMAQLAAAADAGVVIMHNARLYRRDESAEQADIITTTRDFLANSLDVAWQAGLRAEQLALDPGIGFAVNTAESLSLIRHLSALSVFGLPILIGPSRKRFIGDILHVPVSERLMGTAAAVAVSIAHGADFVRVHDVAQMAAIVKMSDAICRGSQEGSSCPKI